jgi:hypothetical protein
MSSFEELPLHFGGLFQDRDRGGHRGTLALLIPLRTAAMVPGRALVRPAKLGGVLGEFLSCTAEREHCFLLGTTENFSHTDMVEKTGDANSRRTVTTGLP